MKKYISFILFISLIGQLNKSIAQSAGDSVFSSNQIHTLYFQFNQTNWWDSLTATYTGDYYIKANAIIDGVTYTNIGVKFKGNSSYNNSSVKKSLKIDFNQFDTTLAWNDLKKLNLNNGFKDPTFLREKVCLDFLYSHGVYAPRCTYANVYLNNQLWGLYDLVEEVNSTFLKDRFSNKDGNLFKGDPHGDLKYFGSNLNAYYPNYELHSNQTINDWSDLLNLITVLNNSPSASLESLLGNVLDLNSWYNLWACNILFANLDSYQGSGHNYFIYHNTTTNKFDWIAWDVNEAFGNFQQGLSLQQIKNLSPDYLPSPIGNRPLEEKLLAITSMKASYYDAIYQMLSTGFDTATLYPLIDSLVDWIRPSVYADPNKFFTNANFETNINFDLGNTPALKPFIPARINAVLSVLIAAGYSPLSSSDLQNENSSFQIFPNPAYEIVNVFNSGNDFSIFSMAGKSVQVFSSNKQITQTNISDMTDGIYLLKNSKGQVAKFVVIKK
ncbi:hypothetical protein LBMAG27_11930 [Bacteroidota bacterium]|nr:hypothetical protein LBMAG27_11930 [Bacteroidota bacterium]